MGRRTVATTLAASLAVGVVAAGPALARDVGELPPRIREVEPRILDVEARILDVEARIEDVVVPNEGNTEIPIASDVLFAFGSAELGDDARGQLAGVIDRIDDASPSRVVIEGHTDAIGDDAANQVLAEQRAEAVRAELGAANPGLAAEAAGFGETRPVAPNEHPDGTDNPGGRQQNRRVTIILVP